MRGKERVEMLILRDTNCQQPLTHDHCQHQFNNITNSC